jgi:hypothetical protein
LTPTTNGRRVGFIPNLEALTGFGFGDSTSPFKHVGHVVFPSTGGTDLRFDNFSAARSGGS